MSRSRKDLRDELREDLREIPDSLGIALCDDADELDRLEGNLEALGHLLPIVMRYAGETEEPSLQGFAVYISERAANGCRCYVCRIVSPEPGECPMCGKDMVPA